VRVYTVAGRLIQRLELVHVSDQFVRIPWDGRDREGEHVANGVYLYKVIVRTIDRSNAREFIGKLAVVQ
jgi:flagellar hook assembly protein FlgD